MSNRQENQSNEPTENFCKNRTAQATDDHPIIAQFMNLGGKDSSDPVSLLTQAIGHDAAIAAVETDRKIGKYILADIPVQTTAEVYSEHLGNTYPMWDAMPREAKKALSFMATFCHDRARKESLGIKEATV